MPADTNLNKALRLVMLLGLLLLEVILIVGFYVAPQMHAQKYAPDGHWQLEAPHGAGMMIATVAFLGLFSVGNAGIILLIWRAFKDLVSSLPQKR